MRLQSVLKGSANKTEIEHEIKSWMEEIQVEQSKMCVDGCHDVIHRAQQIEDFTSERQQKIASIE